MRISSKGRYALGAMIEMALGGTEDFTAVVSISQKLGISKIYLEQVFSVLKRNGLVLSEKGARGGYKLRLSPSEIKVLDILKPLELALFEKPEGQVGENAPEVGDILTELVFSRVDLAIVHVLESVTLADLAQRVGEERAVRGYMYYI